MSRMQKKGGPLTKKPSRGRLRQCGRMCLAAEATRGRPTSTRCGQPWVGGMQRLQGAPPAALDPMSAGAGAGASDNSGTGVSGGSETRAGERTPGSVDRGGSAAAAETISASASRRGIYNGQ